MLPLKTSYATLVGFSLREIREYKDFSQSGAAKSVGVSEPTMSRIEKGETAITSEQVCLAAIAFDVTPASIFERADEIAEELKANSWEIEPLRIQKDGVDLLLKGLATGLTLSEGTISRAAFDVGLGSMAGVIASRAILGAVGPAGWLATAAASLAVAAISKGYKAKDKSRSKSTGQSVFATALAGANVLRQVS